MGSARKLTVVTVLVALAFAVWPVVGDAKSRLALRALVTYVHAERVYLDRGSTHGVGVGDGAKVTAGGKTIARLEVLDTAPHSCVARYVEMTRAPRIGDPAVILRQHRPVRDAPAATLRAPSLTDGVWKQLSTTTFTKISFNENRAPVPVLRQVRSSAYLRGVAWVYVDANPVSIYQRQELDASVHGPIDDDGDFWVDADLRVDGQTIQPDGARFRPADPLRVDVYQASLSYLGVSKLGLALGRMPSSRLRFGLYDGAALSYELAELMKVEVGAGLRPDLITSVPGLDLPFASLWLSGSKNFSWGFGSYGMGASWLGQNGKSEGLESSAGLTLGVGRRWWIDAEAGLLVVDGAASAVTLDRMTVTSSYRVLETTTLRIAARRWQDPPLASASVRLPAGYLDNSGTWDTYAALDTALGRVGPLALTANIAGGGVTDATWSDPRLWVAPSLAMVASNWWRMRLSLGYRGEFGLLPAQYGEIGVGLEPTTSLRVDLWQQVGVLLPTESGDMLISTSSWLALAWAVAPSWSLGLRGRTMFGEAGNGFETHLWLSAHDWL